MLAPETPELLVLGCQSLDEGLLVHARPPHAVEEPSLQIVDASLYPRRPRSVKARATHGPRGLHGIYGNAGLPCPMRCTALALNAATIGPPSVRPRSATDRAVTVATSGKPTSTTTRVAGAEAVTRTMVPGR